jgi:hypothetical protein
MGGETNEDTEQLSLHPDLRFRAAIERAGISDGGKRESSPSTVNHREHGGIHREHETFEWRHCTRLIRGGQSI